ncbi:hypothetical protein CBM2606_A110093 [Cupriavidus taiwanensis]|nr:hypothetical protein CBM2606_A110093 [Cupriavidus taiwanensis]
MRRRPSPPAPLPRAGEGSKTGQQDLQGLKSDAFRLGQTYRPYLDSSHPGNARILNSKTRQSFFLIRLSIYQ